ncbi:MAG: ATP-dependent RecD-like DNA helicase [Candidatus Binatia bacterium]
MAEERDKRSILQGTITKITYQDPEGRYTVARLEVGGSQEVTVVGEIFPVGEGEEIKVSGLWRVHPRYGLQFQAERWEKLEPATLEGIERYLGSGLIKGIGPTYARRLVSAFGLDTLKVLSEEPHRLLEVQGIGEMRAQRIRHAWEKQKGMREVMVFLQGHGVSSSLALKIYRIFGSETVVRVKENPYCLAREIYGIGFLLADRIAGSMGISGDFPLRVQAGLLHVLRKFSDEGHCFVPLDLLGRNASVLLGVGEEAIQSAIEKLAAEGEVILEEPDGEGATRVYPQEFYQAERRVATALRDLLSTPSCLRVKGIKGSRDEGDQALGHLFNPLTLDPLNSLTFMLEEEQREAVCQALRQKVLVITGGPGTGKTTLLTSLLTLLRGSKVSFALAAPTGRAAKRMGEMAGEEAKTIHRLLEYSPRDRGFQRGENNPLGVDVVIIDEASMVDLPLMDHLLRAVESHSHLILLGDVDQLPSVGPGSVLRDLIDSGVVPVVVLRRIFRQGRESLIVVNAHRILQGQHLLFGDERERRDFVFIAREDQEEILETIKELLKRGLRDQGTKGSRNFLTLFSFNPSTLDLFKDVQILSPMHRGLLGTVHLNRELQKLLNSDGESVERRGTPFRLGDKVMQLRNNYDKGVFNGDLGKIVGIDKEEGELQVDFYGRSVSYEFDELDEISLAYATSIHKSQGSEYPVVVIPLHTSHYLMLHRSILYTAVTRGKEMVVLVGSKRALSMAIRNVRVEKRFTGLKEKLIEN